MTRRLATGVARVAAAADVNSAIIDEARTAVRRGDALLLDDAFGGAAQRFGEALGLVSNSMRFDIDLFEQNVVEAVAPNVIGYAYTIGRDGVLYREGAGGLARTGADAPQTAQSPLKEHFLASVSKTVTGVALQRGLQNAGIPVTAQVAPADAAGLAARWTSGRPRGCWAASGPHLGHMQRRFSAPIRTDGLTPDYL